MFHFLPPALVIVPAVPRARTLVLYAQWKVYLLQLAPVSAVVPAPMLM